MEGSTAVPVHAKLSKLKPDTTYYYRLQATNVINGLTNPGEARQDQHFTTPGPSIDEESASDVASSSATLDARITPRGAPTSFYFQYGTSKQYGKKTKRKTLSAGTSLRSVVASISGLKAGKTYHFRLVAVNANGTFDGKDAKFTTKKAKKKKKK